MKINPPAKHIPPHKVSTGALNIVKPPRLGETVIKKDKTSKESKPVSSTVKIISKEQLKEKEDNLNSLLTDIENIKQEIERIFLSKRIMTGRVREEIKDLFKKYSDLNFAAMNEMVNLVQDSENT